MSSIIEKIKAKKEQNRLEITKEGCDYVIKATDNRFVYELSRKDGKILGAKEVIPRDLYNSWRSIIFDDLATSRILQGEKFYIEHKFSEDHSKLIMTIILQKQSFTRKLFKLFNK